MHSPTHPSIYPPAYLSPHPFTHSSTCPPFIRPHTYPFILSLTQSQVSSIPLSSPHSHIHSPHILPFTHSSIFSPALPIHLLPTHPVISPFIHSSFYPPSIHQTTHFFTYLLNLFLNPIRPSFYPPIHLHATTFTHLPTNVPFSSPTHQSI